MALDSRALSPATFLISGFAAGALLVTCRVWRFRTDISAMFGAMGPGRTRSARMGVSSTFAKEHAWWLQGQRLDTAVLFETLGEAGIRELSTEFYGRVYADDMAPWFRDMFRFRASLQQSIDRQAAFFTQFWGGPTLYTANNRPHCLRKLVGDHAGAKMFVMHEEARIRNEITEEAARRWLYHMDMTLLNLRPAWSARHGEKLAIMLEKTVRWFCDHVLERLVWGGPTESPWRLQRFIFHIFTRITALYVVRDLHYVAS